MDLSNTETMDLSEIIVCGMFLSILGLAYTAYEDASLIKKIRRKRRWSVQLIKKGRTQDIFIIYLNSQNFLRHFCLCNLFLSCRINAEIVRPRKLNPRHYYIHHYITYVKRLCVIPFFWLPWCSPLNFTSFPLGAFKIHNSWATLLDFIYYMAI